MKYFIIILILLFSCKKEECPNLTGDYLIESTRELWGQAIKWEYYATIKSDSGYYIEDYNIDFNHIDLPLKVENNTIIINHYFKEGDIFNVIQGTGYKFCDCIILDLNVNYDRKYRDILWNIDSD